MNQDAVNKIGEALVARAVDDWKALREGGVRLVNGVVIWPEGVKKIRRMSRDDAESAIDLMRRTLCSSCERAEIDPYAALSRLGLPEHWADNPPERAKPMEIIGGPKVPLALMLLPLKSKPATMVLATLYAFAIRADDEAVHISLYRLSEETGLCYATVKTCLELLASKGWIRKRSDHIILNIVKLRDELTKTGVMV